MTVIQFESVVEGNIIRIPEQYIGQIPSIVTVKLVDTEKPRYRHRTTKELPNIDEFSTIFRYKRLEI